MSDHLTGEQLKGYEAGAMAASALLEADRHLAQCSACRQELQHTVRAPRLPELVQQMGEPLHLTYEQMAGFIDTSLPAHAVERVEQHTAICRACARELAELQEFDARMIAELHTAVTAKQPRPGWVPRMRAAVAEYLAAPQRLNWASAGVGLMVLGFISLLQAVPAAPGKSSAALAQVSALVFSASTPLHPQLFYGGFVVAACGGAVLLYAFFKR